MQPYLIEMLVCPSCHGELEWNISERNENRIETANAECRTCSKVYLIREGIGVFLTSDLTRNDLWEQSESGLVKFLREHPEIERQLMEAPLETLNSTDQFFRMFVLEERGNFEEAKRVEKSTGMRLYTPEVLNCLNSQTDYVINWLSSSSGPIVDLASGRGYLVEKIVQKLKRPVAATDFSISVLRKNLTRLKGSELYDNISFLAFDARRTPFRDRAISIMTTNLGLANIEEPGSLLKELRRVVNGTLVSISHFYPEEDEENAKVICDAKLDKLLFKHSALEYFQKSGWEVEIKNSCACKASPTPPSNVLEGAKIDEIPVADTFLEWCVLFGTAKEL